VTAPARKYLQAAAIARAQVADGTLRPGQAAPSGAALASLTGFAPLTCRKALRALEREGVLVPGPTPSARLRVKALPGASAGDAARSLSRALAAARRASGLTQPALAALAGCSVTTIGHAETGRLWQSRQFWEKIGLALAAGGELTRLYDAYRTESASAGGGTPPSSMPLPAGSPALTRLTLTGPTALPPPPTRRTSPSWQGTAITVPCPRRLLPVSPPPSLAGGPSAEPRKAPARRYVSPRG
jgi:DNA-binding XRE family transcriptional regulator